MAFQINFNAVRTNPNLGGAPAVWTKSDSAGFFTKGSYPRGFIVLTGGTLVVWVEDESNSGSTVKLDLGTVPDGFTWTWGGIFGISTDSTAADIIAIP